MLELLDEWKFLAGLGIFLFGMFMMEESIKLLSGRSFKTLIRRYTGSRLKGLATGIVSTSILQSSSAVSLMVLAFVGAGLMTLVNAIAVIIGAKMGTTVTAWIVAVFGFKEIQEIGNEDHAFMIEADRTFKKRLDQLRMVVGQVVLHPDTSNVTELLNGFFNLVEGMDKTFIRACSQAVAEKTIKAQDITRLLMANRLFTQSSRMLVLSMQGLTRQMGALESS